MVGQSEELIQDKNKNVMKAIIGMSKKIFITIRLSLGYSRIELSIHVKAYGPALETGRKMEAGIRGRNHCSVNE
jgi:hypothetical protein